MISYASKSTSETESNYDAYKLEILAIVWSTDHFHYYLTDIPFTVQTDNQAITWLNNKKKEAKGQIARWIMTLMQYQITYIHHPGTHNRNANALSRIPCKPKNNNDKADTLS